jgi:hypothetical protein
VPEAARAELVDRRVDISELFHDVGGVSHRGGQEGRLSSPDPARRLIRIIQRSGRQRLAVTQIDLCVIGRLQRPRGGGRLRCTLEVGRK